MHYKVLLALLSVLLGGLQTAQACSCIPPSPPDVALGRAAAVFAGQVTDVLEVSGGQLQVAFKVDRAWKGVERQHVVVYTSGSSASCGYEFAEGQAYLVYADQVDDALSASLCSRTAKLQDASADLNVLGAATTPEARRCGGSNNLAALQAFLLVLAGSILIHRKRSV